MNYFKACVGQDAILRGEVVGHGFGLAAELLLGAACQKSRPSTR
jgi:hypothetical protein